MAEHKSKRRWMPVVLGLSLALNLAVVAAVAGAAWRHKGEERDGPRAARGGAIYMQALPREARREVRAQLRSIGREQAGTDAMLGALRQEPFDPAAAVQVLESERDTGLARQTAASALWLEQITAMSAQERLAYADRLEALLQHRGKDWKERRGEAD